MRVINFLAEKYYKIAYDTFFYIEDNKKANKYVQYALDIEPNHIKALRLKGAILLLEDKIKPALEVWKKLYRMNQDDFEVTSKLAYCLGETGSYDEALEFCEKSAVQVSLGDFEKMSALYKLKIDLLLDTKKPKSAFKLFKNALKILKSSDAYELKQSYSFLDFYNDAVVDFKKTKKAL